MKKITLSIALALVLVSTVGAASAITNGTPDGDAHPYVGLIVFDVLNEAGEQVPSHRCSASLLTDTVVLTARAVYQASPQPELKRAALIALSWSQDIRSLPFLIDALSNEELQEFAINGIMVMGEQALPGVFAALRQGERPQRGILAKMVSMLGGGTTLIKFAGDDDPDVRVEVAIAISSLHSPEKNEILSRMLEDPEEEVRLAASRGLEVSID